MGPGLLPILYALKDTMAFFIVTITSLLAATHAYYNLQIKDLENAKDSIATSECTRNRSSGIVFPSLLRQCSQRIPPLNTKPSMYIIGLFYIQY